MTPPPPHPSALVAGCGDLGTEVALRLTTHGERVLGLRRRAELLPSSVAGLATDLTTETPVLPEGTYTSLAVVLTADGRDASAYRATYVEGLRHTLDALETAGPLPERAVLVSSTGVYGGGEGWIDETGPVAPSRPTHEILLEAERLFHERLPHGTVLRLSGLYGPGRGAFVRRARAGEVEQRWTNRIHRDDAAAAVVHLLTDADAPPSLLIGSDTEPAPAREVADAVRRLSGLDPLPGPSGGDPIPGRRLRSEALQATGFTFLYPTYREGYRAVLAGEGVRHP